MSNVTSKTEKAKQALQTLVDSPEGALQILRLLSRYSSTCSGEEDDEMWEVESKLSNSKVSLRDGRIDNEWL